MTTGIQVEGLVKRYGDHTAVDGVDLTVPAGTVLGLLGPNGAGKTTTVRMLATLVKPDAGRATVLGYDVVTQAQQVRQLIGLTGQFAAVDADLSGRDNLYLIGRLLDMPRRRARERVDRMLERFGLTDAATKLVRDYSGGMRRRLDLAACLLGSPRVIYLDEPTTGLDPHSRNGLWATVRELVADGSTVLLTTQYMEEAEALADSLVVMRNGGIIASGTVAELAGRVGGRTLLLTTASPDDAGELAAGLRAQLPGHQPDQDGDQVRLPLAHDEDLAAALQAVAAATVTVTAVDTRVPTLDEVFITLTGAATDAEPERSQA
ncbi:ATP-binding cassette domain-containing protein [Actinoplanes sp. KI2]|uniref:ATP-binding cassette domain-containing protein n=1 Tax=Actinoplanes sp. KI2 TaxID=2983315 RepID=UPI0021D61057|nr:ATP-binding cassette domain-containing protein [Actinoplanes sp. KI2]MCU7728826.1 ATP-binding cassette domain-containing protein [Actinoplanes sp. KI2]